MRTTRIIAASVHCVWTFVIAMVAATGALADPAAVLPKGAKYVSLGSSFAAGPGIPPQQPSCGRSDNNYPHLVAAALGLELTDASCSGATTAHILDTPQGTAAPQIAALASDTALVTVTIGGNDISYSGSTIKCGGAKVEEHCAANLDQAAIAESVSRLPAKLANVLTAIHAKSPKAVIVLVPYPRVIPPQDQRCVELGLAVDDANYFAALGEQLENALVSAATSQHALVADAYVRGAGHGPCADAANRWVNGAKPAGSGAAFHPTANGHKEMARLVLAALGVSSRMP
jgi:lysophospholipase L1-like esterase